MEAGILEISATVIFVLAIIHTFSTNYFLSLAHKHPEGSVRENLFHFLGEVEVVFGLWSAIFILIYSAVEGFVQYDANHKVIGGALHYLESLNYTEPAFVFVIMAMAGTRPIILFAEKLILGAAGWLPFSQKASFYMATLIIGPLLGSFITEPAAMTVTALILLNYFYKSGMSKPFQYATIGLLFVNISVGGTLTHFAAPPVLMVASKWHWGILHMISNFGFKAALGIVLCTVVTTLIFKKELKGEVKLKKSSKDKMLPPLWVTMLHLIFIGMVVYTAHHIVFFMGLFLFFLGFVKVTQEFQDEVKLKESLLVGFFLGGLVVLGTMQAWWLQDLLLSLNDLTLFIGATGLTAITDNAALTYLGSLVELSDSAKFNLVAGAVAGGGLTVIANAPNPAGFGILKGSFKDGINPLYLLMGAITPTIVMCLFLKVIPSLNLEEHAPRHPTNIETHSNVSSEHVPQASEPPEKTSPSHRQ